MILKGQFPKLVLDLVHSGGTAHFEKLIKVLSMELMLRVEMRVPIIIIALTVVPMM